MQLQIRPRVGGGAENAYGAEADGQDNHTRYNRALRDTPLELLLPFRGRLRPDALDVQ